MREFSLPPIGGRAETITEMIDALVTVYGSQEAVAKAINTKSDEVAKATQKLISQYKNNKPPSARVRRSTRGKAFFEGLSVLLKEKAISDLSSRSLADLVDRSRERADADESMPPSHAAGESESQEHALLVSGYTVWSAPLVYAYQTNAWPEEVKLAMHDSLDGGVDPDSDGRFVSVSSSVAKAGRDCSATKLTTATPMSANDVCSHLREELADIAVMPTTLLGEVPGVASIRKIMTSTRCCTLVYRRKYSDLLISAEFSGNNVASRVHRESSIGRNRENFSIASVCLAVLALELSKSPSSHIASEAETPENVTRTEENLKELVSRQAWDDLVAAVHRSTEWESLQRNAGPGNFRWGENKLSLALGAEPNTVAWQWSSDAIGLIAGTPAAAYETRNRLMVDIPSSAVRGMASDSDSIVERLTKNDVDCRLFGVLTWEPLASLLFKRCNDSKENSVALATISAPAPAFRPETVCVDLVCARSFWGEESEERKVHNTRLLREVCAAIDKACKDLTRLSESFDSLGGTRDALLHTAKFFGMDGDEGVRRFLESISALTFHSGCCYRGFPSSITDHMG